jgi:hypothetical protein
MISYLLNPLAGLCSGETWRSVVLLLPLKDDALLKRWSVSNSLAMIVPVKLYPFQRQEGRRPCLRDLYLHELPWPGNGLEPLDETSVQMRVTLSYFIEPNPSARGRSRYRYESHSFRLK